MKLRRNPLILLALLLLPFAGSGQAVKTDARLDTTTMLIGDQTGLKLTFTAPAGTRVEWPSLPDTLMQNLQIIGRGKVDTTWSKDRRTMTLSQQFTLTSFDSGFYSLPQIPVYYQVPPDKDTLRDASPMMFLKVTTLAVDTTRAIKPIKGPMTVPLTFREILPWILLGLGVAGVILAVIWYIRRRRKNIPLIDIHLRPQLKPHEIALKELQALRDRKMWQSGQVKQFHTEMTDILRKYLEERFMLSAMESTTDEIMDGLKEAGVAGADDVILLQKILTLADLVKFAKAQPLPAENEGSMESAVRFVTDTIPENKEVKTSV